MTHKLLIHKPSRSVVIKGHHEQVTDVIPRSRLMTVFGKDVTVIKHDDAETKALLDMGFEVPSPFMTYYQPPKLQGRFDPMDHQMLGAEFHTLNKRSFNLSEPRTGKTYTILMAFDYLKQQGAVKNMIVFSTLSTMDSVWCGSVFDSFHKYNYASVHASSSGQRREILEGEADIYVCNHDGAKLLEKEIIAKKFDMIVWDEADNLCNAQSTMFKAFHKIAKDVKYVILATATPTGENRPTDAWALAKIVNPEKVPKYFGAFRNLTMRQITQFKWVPLPTASKTVHEVLQPAFCVRKADVMTLPELKAERKTCKLTDEQAIAYKEMKDDLETELANGKLTAIHGADALTKSLQILLGVYKTADDEYNVIPCQPRIDAVLECITATDRKALVFCGFTGALRHYTKEINKHYPAVMVDGSVGKKERDKIFRAFAAKDGPRVLVAQQITVSHGLEFGENCDTIIWAGPIHSGRRFTQANERIVSMKQTSDMKIWYIGANKFEFGLYDKLEAKRDMQSEVLDLCKLVIDKD